MRIAAPVKTEILYGFHAVREALSAGRRDPVELYIDREHVASSRLQGIRESAEARGVAIRRLTAAQLAALAGTATPPVVALRASPYPLEELAGIADAVAGTGSDPVLVLDGIVDPHNLGAIVRSALCAGVAAVVIPKDRSAPPTPAVSKISAGALEHIRLVQVTNLVRTLEHLKSCGRWVAGLDRLASRSVFEADLTMPLALVIGGEARGMRTLVRKTCDLMVSIPQSGAIDSLNAAAAAAVALYEIRRQRGVDRPAPREKPRGADE
jgi:23S rRNA (guanosine2251-2'-O)-methyltransferase